MNEIRSTYKQRINVAKDIMRYFKHYEKKVFPKDTLQQYLAEKEKVSHSTSLQSEMELAIYLKSDMAFISREGIEGELINQEIPEFKKRDFSGELDYLIKCTKSTYKLASNEIVEIPVQKIMDRKHLSPVLYTSTEWTITPSATKEPTKKMEPRYMNLHCPINSSPLSSLEELQNLLKKGNKRGDYRDERSRLVKYLKDAENDLECEKYHYITSEEIFTTLKNAVQRYRSELNSYDSRYGPFNTNTDAFSHYAEKEGIASEFIQYVAWFSNLYEEEIRETSLYTWDDKTKEDYRKIKNLKETVSGK
jgi:hypothetical protein